MAADPELAASWYKKAAEQGYPDGECCYGVCLEQGVGVEKDPKEAVLWYQKAALHGHATGMNNLGACYERGNGVEKDEQAALMWYERAAERGSSYGCRNAARFYQDGKGAPKDEKKTAEYLEKCAMLGDSDAMVRIGRLYELGKGVERDGGKALEFYEAAAERGDALGMRVMGMIYRDGRSVRKNLAKARYWFEKAAKKGDVLSDVTVAFCCLTGIAEKPDPERAVSILKNRARSKYVGKDGEYAMYLLGYCYEKGLAVEKDRKKALKLYRKGAENQSEEALYRLALYYSEEAEEKDETKAEEYCRRVCPDFSLSPSVQFPEEELSERVERLLDKIKKTMKEEDVSNGLDKI